jgi:hypothetical protein
VSIAGSEHSRDPLFFSGAIVGGRTGLVQAGLECVSVAIAGAA